MNKIFTLFFSLLILTSCTSTSKVSKSGFSEMGLVSEFITLMVNNAAPAGMMKYISPSYLKENNINKADYKVNTYAPVDFRIENYINGMVFAKIWGNNRSWVHRLTFMVVKEEGKLYLKPGKHYDKVIDPWHRAETYLVE
ncbi:hypothetical protein ACFLRZ_01240 [Bacteroidota bacterium]